jgi:general secretion pathway protein J
MARPGRSRQASGFTLIEVLVALAVMAVMATVSWQGLSTLLRTQDASRAATQRIQGLDLAISQWEADLNALVATGVVPSLSYDGATLRLSRRSAVLPDNPVERPSVGTHQIHLVVWACRDGQWQRWQGPGIGTVRVLQDQWLAGPSAERWLSAWSDCQQMQLQAFRDGAWTNLMSAADRATPAAGSSPGAGTSETEPARQALRQAAQDVAPQALRLMLMTSRGTLTRDWVLPLSTQALR